MNIYDTLSKTTKKFIPINPHKVSFYQCGPTMYWNQHIGNMRSVVLADFINRTLKYLDYEVMFVRNYTDVGHLTSDGDEGEDKMEKAVKRDNKDPESIFQYYKEIYEKDTLSLNTLSPEVAPRATEHVEEMIQMIQDLIEKGFAYQTELAIYFNITKKEHYTALSGQDISKLISGVGHGDITDKNKKNLGDFALWFFKSGTHENAIQAWKNPFSKVEGFPGWHIECSAMSKKYLGETIDIHMGGIEHIPIHHTNEIAQSESVHGNTFVNYWVHNEHLLVDGKKMSKSEGTSFLISDIIEKGYSPLDLRYFFLQAHYRSKQNFTWKALEASKQARKKLHTKIASFDDNGEVHKTYKQEFTKALEGDFGLPEALSVVYSVLSSNIKDADKKATILDFDSVLGLSLDQYTDLNRPVSHIDLPEPILSLLDQRLTARNTKKWDESDAIRDELAMLGYTVVDEADGQNIYKK